MNKANNPECQGNDNDLRKKKVLNEFATDVENRNKLKVVGSRHNPFTENRELIRMVIGKVAFLIQTKICSLERRALAMTCGKNFADLFDFLQSRIASQRKAHE